MTVSSVDSNPTTRRNWLRGFAALLPSVLGGCTGPVGSSLAGGATRKARAQWEFQHYFLASGARFRYHPYGGQGRAWTSDMQRTYEAYRRDPRVGYVVKNLYTGAYNAAFQADRLFMGGSMPKPMIAAMLLEKRRGSLSYEEFMHAVMVCDKSVNSSWMALHARLTGADEAAFRAKYHLPTSHVLANQLSPRFIAEFYERCVNYRFDHGGEFLLEAMRRDQYGFGRLFLPRSVTYVGGKTGNYGEWDHESLFFYHGSVPYSIVVFTSGHFSPGKMNWPIAALMGGLFRDYVAGPPRHHVVEEVRPAVRAF
jgi:hypothetical protein